MEKLWTEKDLADYLQQSTLTVRRNRTAAPHRHPPFIKIGSSCRYDPAEVKRWLNAQTINRQEDSTAPVPAKQTHRGAPTKAERIAKAKHAGK